MTASPAFFLQPLTLSKRRSKAMTLDLYTADGTPLPIESGDQIRAKVWATDDASPDLEISKATSNSIITVDTVGSVGTPARITILFHQTDTANLTAGTSYYFELFLVDSSDSNLAKPICRADVVVLGTATGSTGT